MKHRLKQGSGGWAVGKKAFVGGRPGGDMGGSGGMCTRTEAEGMVEGETG